MDLLQKKTTLYKYKAQNAHLFDRVEQTAFAANEAHLSVMLKMQSFSKQYTSGHGIAHCTIWQVTRWPKHLQC